MWVIVYFIWLDLLSYDLSSVSLLQLLFFILFSSSENNKWWDYRAIVNWNICNGFILLLLVLS